MPDKVLPVTQHTKLCVAARRLTDDGKPLFTGQDLAVQAWQMFRESFSMAGYDYPDTQKVMVALSGDNGMVGRGLLSRPSPGVYQLTAEGRQWAKEAEEPLVKTDVVPPKKERRPPKTDVPPVKIEPSHPPRNVVLPYPLEQWLRDVLESTVMRNANVGLKTESTVNDVRAFFGINGTSGAVERWWKACDEVGTLVHNADVELAGGRVVTAKDVRRVADVAHECQGRFAGKLVGDGQRKAGHA